MIRDYENPLVSHDKFSLPHHNSPGLSLPNTQHLHKRPQYPQFPNSPSTSYDMPCHNLYFLGNPHPTSFVTTKTTSKHLKRGWTDANTWQKLSKVFNLSPRNTAKPRLVQNCSAGLNTMLVCAVGPPWALTNKGGAPPSVEKSALLGG